MAAHLGIFRDACVEFHEASRPPGGYYGQCAPVRIWRAPPDGLILARFRAARPASACGISRPPAEGRDKPFGGDATKPADGASVGGKYLPSTMRIGP